MILLVGQLLIGQGTVFPGDSDRNGRVDHYDVLPMGVAFGSFGPTRDSSSLQEAQNITNNWPGVFPTGVNFIHADANGSGLVDFMDFIVVSQNQGVVHASVQNALNTPLFTDVDPLISVGAGATLNPNEMSGANMEIPIVIERERTGAWLNGIAFTIKYDPTLIAAASFEFTDDWLGVNGQAFKFQRDDEAGEIRIAITRFGPNPVTGNGEIGTLNLVIIEDLIGFLPATPGVGTEMITLEGVFGVDGTYTEVPFAAQPLRVAPVNALLSDIDDPSTAEYRTSVFPNPVDQQLTITATASFDTLELFDLHGRGKVLYQGPGLEQWTGYLDQLLPPGLYYLRSSGPKGFSVTALVIR
ncbi:MAG: hypothetical protein AAF828_12860 [Bacteroidota bacterium]